MGLYVLPLSSHEDPSFAQAQVYILSKILTKDST